jgi:hypothetical protein
MEGRFSKTRRKESSRWFLPSVEVFVSNDGLWNSDPLVA